jgi:hypothetical protein
LEHPDFAGIHYTGSHSSFKNIGKKSETTLNTKPILEIVGELVEKTL